MFKKFPMCMYKPGTLPLAHMLLSATTVHDEDELAAALADGWKADPGECEQPAPVVAAAPAAPEPAAPTRADLEAKATALGVKFDGRVSDKTLIERIAAATKPAA